MHPCDHLTTDPLCRFHTVPRTWWERRRFNKARGQLCYRCSRSRTFRANDAAIQKEVMRTEAMRQVRDLENTFLAGMPGNPTIRQAWIARGYTSAMGDVLRALSHIETGAPKATFRVSSPSEREH